jgi:Protein of unknown function (DUF3060)
LSWADAVWEHLPMKPQDDPEARIRDLERPLADRAQTSELGTQPYTAAGAHPQAAYDTPYPVAPQPYSKGPSHTSVIVLVVIVLTLLVVGAGVAIYFAKAGPRDGAVTAGQPKVAGGGVSNTVTITGHCVSVTVSGVDNEVIVESADRIGASGFENRVTFQTGDPRIDNFGDNIVERG